MTKTLKIPSAWIPLALTVAILCTFALVASTHGLHPEQDEGTPAHLFQLWVVLEVCFIAFFAYRHAFHEGKQPRQILALQIALALVPFILVFSFHL